ncbi:hypothetical protein MLGJGCBP_03739 [Rhodococcus sp. T7]|nr:hypothetical protein MLGJGCBP_03739 [Rhodococcus sp. T7]
MRPSDGRISAACPVTRCERFSFVDTCTVNAHRRSAASVVSVSGVAETKLPPIPINTDALPSRIARIESTASNPCLRGEVMPNSVSRAVRKDSGIFSQMPIVRSPWTFEWPRTGHTPAPGLPIIPCSSSRFTASWMVATPWVCWVNPIAQQMMVFFDPINASAVARICSSVSPVACTTVPRSTCCRCAAHSSNPAVCRSMNSRSSTVPGAASSASSSNRPNPWNNAWSPPIRICRNSSAIWTPSPTTPCTFCGSLNRSSPASGSGLIAMTFAPLPFAFSSVESIRG